MRNAARCCQAVWVGRTAPCCSPQPHLAAFGHRHHCHGCHQAGRWLGVTQVKATPSGKPTGEEGGGAG